MDQTTAVEQKTLEAILNRLDKLAKELKYIKGILEESEPPYGSQAWWQWSDKKALVDYRKGAYTTINSPKELNDFFESLS